MRLFVMIQNVYYDIKTYFIKIISVYIILIIFTIIDTYIFCVSIVIFLNILAMNFCLKTFRNDATQTLVFRLGYKQQFRHEKCLNIFFIKICIKNIYCSFV